MLGGLYGIFPLNSTWSLPRGAIILEYEIRVREEWHLLNEKTSDYVVIPAKAGIQGLKIIGRQADSGCRLSPA
jgi:hypothetical protein